MSGNRPGVDLETVGRLGVEIELLAPPHRDVLEHRRISRGVDVTIGEIVDVGSINTFGIKFVTGIGLEFGGLVTEHVVDECIDRSRAGKRAENN